MLKYAVMIVPFSLGCAITSVFVVYASKRRGTEYYRKKLATFNPELAPYVQYAFDMVCVFIVLNFV
jgi:hypothetical protein